MGIYLSSHLQLCTVKVVICYQVMGSGVNNTTEMGEGVVHDVLARIEEANIFDSDHYFMKRLAYVETRDGEHFRASSGNYGIWV